LTKKFNIFLTNNEKETRSAPSKNFWSESGMKEGVFYCLKRDQWQFANFSSQVFSVAYPFNLRSKIDSARV